MSTYDDICLWSKEKIQEYLRDRGLSTTGSKDKLRALVYGAIQFNAPLLQNVNEINKERAIQYRNLLTINNSVLPDPLSDLTSGWVGEENGMSIWPPCMYCDLTEYLVDSSEKDLRTRLLTDYKEGKAFSYFDSKWLKQVFYHDITPDSPYCFLKAECLPSMNVNYDPHKVWVCISKKTGKIISGYCSCFAGLGSTCNHVAAVLFKLDYAWQNGYTNKACTSIPAEWATPSKKKSVIEPKRVREMGWRKPHYTKNAKDGTAVINPPIRQLFNPVKNCTDDSPTLESLMGSLYVSCGTASAFQYAIPRTDPTYDPDDDVNVISEVEVTTSVSVPPSLKELATLHSYSFNSPLPILDKVQVAIIEEATRKQSGNPQWVEQRTGRITGSYAHAILTKARKIMNRTDVGTMDNLLDYILGEKTLDPNLRPLKHGRQMEPLARARYLQVYKHNGHRNATSRECGLFVHPDDIYMAASPDAVISCECCGTGVLEIKCPLQIAHSNPQSCPPSYLIRNEHDQLILKETHPYHIQILMQLLVTDYEWCDFFVFTRNGHHLQRIYKHVFTDSIKELHEAAKVIFTQFIVPRLRSLSSEIEHDCINPATETYDVSDDAAEQGFQVDEARSQPPPKKRQRRQAKQQKTNTGPIYLCSVCQGVCKDVTEIDDEIDNSVGCDTCYKWFHWGCVGYDGYTSEDWHCSSCSDVI